jgi:hypothetical protein
MFNLKDLGDMSKLAGQAQEIQRKQDRNQQEQLQVLMKISNTLEQILTELKKTS